MMEADAFSQWLGIQVEEVKPGYSRLVMTVRKEMVNGFGIAHGGITFSLADSALAFASNGYGRQCVSIETSIAHITPVRTGDRLEAVAEEDQRSSRLGRYTIRVKRGEDLVALFKGTVFITEKNWD